MGPGHRRRGPLRAELATFGPVTCTVTGPPLLLTDQLRTGATLAAAPADGPIGRPMDHCAGMAPGATEIVAVAVTGAPPPPPPPAGGGVGLPRPPAPVVTTPTGSPGRAPATVVDGPASVVDVSSPGTDVVVSLLDVVLSAVDDGLCGSTGAG